MLQTEKAEVTETVLTVHYLFNFSQWYSLRLFNTIFYYGNSCTALDHALYGTHNPLLISHPSTFVLLKLLFKNTCFKIVLFQC